MSEMEELELSRTQKFAGNIIAGALTVLCGLFLLLCGLDVFEIAVLDVLAASILSTIGLVLLITGIIQKNTVSLWVACAFLVPALVEVLTHYTNLTYGNLYPLYIAIPAISSLVAMAYSREWRAHIVPIVLFGAIAFLFALKSFDIAGWGVVIPLLLVFLGCGIILYAFKVSKKEDK